MERQRTTLTVLLLRVVLLSCSGKYWPTVSIVEAQFGGTDQWYDSETSGSFAQSGSSGDFSSGDVECRVPSDIPEPPALFERELVKEIRCHVSCIEMVAVQEEATIEVIQDLQVWPTVSDSSLERNCSIYQKVQECRSGCVIHSSSPRMSINRCSVVCTRDCEAECNEETVCNQLGSICNRRCSTPACKTGCTIFEQVFRDANGELPLSPEQPPDLLLPDEMSTAGVYSIDLTRAAPVTNTPHYEAGLTSFLFRVLHSESNLIAHFWLRGPDNVLNLEAFACKQDVLVQFAAVNKHGASEWSLYTYLNVYGDSTPLVPENPIPLTIHFTPDTRFGYWKHAIVTVSWDRPKGVEYLSQYVLRLLPSTSQCGNENGNEMNISRDSTSAVLKAEYLRDGPINGCEYHISVSSVALSGEDIEAADSVSFQVNVDNPVPLNFTCGREWNEFNGTFQFTVSWSVPNSIELHKAIHHFSILVKLVSPVIPGGYSIHNTKEIPFNEDIKQYTYKTLPVAFHVSGSYYMVQLQSFAVSYSDIILIPTARSCEFDAMPIPADPIKEISITSDTYTPVDVGVEVAELELSLEWTSPGANITLYQLRLVGVAVFDETSSPGDVYAFEDIEGTLSRVTVRTEVPTVSDSSCAYLQLRSVSVHGAVSNWSAPLCVSLPSPFTTPATTATTPSSSPPTKLLSLQVVYAIVSVGFVLVLAIVILSVFVCIACVQNKRARKEKHIFEEKRSFSVKMFPDVKTCKTGPLGDFPSSSSPVKVMGGWELHPSQLVIDGNLGNGAFGPVYRGTVRDGMGPHQMKNPDSMTVAIKLLRTTCSPKERQIFLQQIAQAKVVSTSSHVHIVNMVGCVTITEPLCLVSELPEGGDLLSFLITARIEGSVYSFKERQAQKESLKADDLLTFAAQITSGMDYLSAIGVVHGDLACRNVYLGAENIAKVCDFSLGRRDTEREGAYVWTPAGRLPLRWMAIEALTHGAFSNASDVWSFGITLWEIITLGGFPYPTINHIDLLAAVQNGYRMEQPSNCSAQLYKLMSQCWQEDATERPSFTLLQEHLQEMLVNGEAEKQLSTELDHSRPYYYKHNLCHSSSGGPANTCTAQRRDETWQGLSTILYSDNLLPRIVEDEHEDMTEEDETMTVTMETHQTSENTTLSECTSTASVTPEAGQTSLDDGQTCSDSGLIQSDGSNTPDKPPATLEGSE